eukprot:Cvel_18551.t1-p1 / transcript=Cvel_18551.t1 / gene=Cvel_18551 / organism=Chromera_velia_CCMP2878 / gene_product=hypothetical protein / transcript_product=hypothetical protein / location=Cvel_scaffold1544:34895-36792(+) / protein_length=405 / sequence_SO=supercontig / SO=protein_coding / is_pseudo=false
MDGILSHLHNTSVPSDLFFPFSFLPLEFPATNLTYSRSTYSKKVLTRRKQKQAGADTNYRLLTDPTKLKAWYARFGHCDLSQLVATLRERQVGMKEEVKKKVWRECELCEDRNAVNRTPHAVPGRREKEAKEYGQLAYCNIGQLVGYPFSVIVKMYSREINVMRLNAKSDVTDHCVRFNAQNRLLLPKPHKQIVTMRSDNENVLRSAKMKATMPYTHFDESTKYHSLSQGPAEAAVKMIKRLARTMMKEKGWPLAVLPHLWEGLAETYMALHMNELGTSPYYKKNGVTDTGFEPQVEEGVWVSPEAQEREGEENAEQLKEEKREMEKGEDEDSSDSSDDDFLLLLQSANAKRGSARAQQPPAAVAAPEVQPQAAAVAQGGQAQGPTPPPSPLPQQRVAAAIRSSA